MKKTWQKKANAEENINMESRRMRRLRVIFVRSKVQCQQRNRKTKNKKKKRKQNEPKRTMEAAIVAANTEHFILINVMKAIGTSSAPKVAQNILMGT